MPWLTVKVLDSYRGYPVDNVLVTVRAGNFKETEITTPHYGDAHFWIDEPGDYEIVARRTDLPYIPYRGNVTVGDEDKEVEVKLLRPIEVIVRDPKGNPINNATVRMVNIATFYDALYDYLTTSKADYEEPVNQEGKIELLPLGTGTYIRIEARAPDYKESDITIPFFVNVKRITLNITLEPKR